MNPALPLVLGIDPGKQGALCLLEIARPRKIVLLQDLPLSADGKDIDANAFSMFLELYSERIRFCVIEKVSAMTYTDASGQKRGQGAAASFNFGKGFGLVLGCLHSARVPLIEVVPSVWKILLGLSSAKHDSILKAHELYPSSRDWVKLKKHDGRAESLLLAHFGAERFGGTK
jgi:hypothetical protein